MDGALGWWSLGHLSEGEGEDTGGMFGGYREASMLWVVAVSSGEGRVRDMAYSGNIPTEAGQ